MSVELRRGDEDLHQRFQRARILFGEAPRAGAVEIEHAEDAPAADHGHHHLASRRTVARDVAGKRVHVRHHHAARLRRGRSADALAERNAHARGLALERTEHELLAAQPVEARPVEIGERMEDERREVRGIRGAVALALEKRARERAQLLVERGRGLLLGTGRREHRGTSIAHAILPRRDDRLPAGGRADGGRKNGPRIDFAGPRPLRPNGQVAGAVVRLLCFFLAILRLCLFCALASFARSRAVTLPSALALSSFASTFAWPRSRFAASFGVSWPLWTPCWMRACWFASRWSTRGVLDWAATGRAIAAASAARAESFMRFSLRVVDGMGRPTRHSTELRGWR